VSADHREPWNSFNSYLRARFGARVHRVALDAGLTCPNRDGTKGRGGCVFCDSAGSRAEYQNPSLPIAEQMRQGMERLEQRFGCQRFIAYFQAYTNTYGPPELLERLWREARIDERVVGLAVGTRPDCASDETLDRLARVVRDLYQIGWVEYGYISRTQAVLDAVNRRERVEDFERAVEAAHARGLPVCAHVIFGLPGEPLEATAQATAPWMARLGIEGVKLHNLFVVRDSPLAQSWRRGEAAPPALGDYVRAVCDFLERISPECLIHRLAGEAPGDRMLAPDWARDKQKVLDSIRAEFARRGTRQGVLWSGATTSRGSSLPDSGVCS